MTPQSMTQEPQSMTQEPLSQSLEIVDLETTHSHNVPLKHFVLHFTYSNRVLLVPLSALCQDPIQGTDITVADLDFDLALRMVCYEFRIVRPLLFFGLHLEGGEVRPLPVTASSTFQGCAQIAFNRRCELICFTVDDEDD
jgi:hypothetical protein